MDINGTYAFESEGALSVNGQGNPLYLRGQLHPYVNNTHNIGGSGMNGIPFISKTHQMLHPIED